MVKTDKPSRLKEFLTNLTLVLVSVVLTYAVLEVVFFRLIVPQQPLSYRIYLPDRADFLLQISKANYIPENYIALVGDSYAQGMGDWLLSQRQKGALPYHSADVIHSLLHRDVVSLGRAAAGSAEAMVQRVTRIYGDSYCYLFPAIGLPKQFLIYFYEGNDIDDNYKLLHHRIRPAGPDVGSQIDRFLDDDYGQISKWRCHGHLGDTIFRMVRYHVRYGLNPDLTFHIDPVPPINRVVVGGAAANARALSVPSLALDDSQVEAGILVYDRALAWFRRRFPQTPATVVYIPAPAVIYRPEGTVVTASEIYDPSETQQPDHPHVSTGRKFPYAAVYPRSQTICEKIRAISLARGTGFMDTRRAFRAAAAEHLLHGPRDWNHFNEAGYRELGKLVAARIDERPADVCDDRWP